MVDHPDAADDMSFDFSFEVLESESATNDAPATAPLLLKSGIDVRRSSLEDLMNSDSMIGHNSELLDVAERVLGVCSAPEASMISVLEDRNRDHQIGTSADGMAKSLGLDEIADGRSLSPRQKKTKAEAATCGSPHKYGHNKDKIVFGICAMDKKTKSSTVTKILDKFRGFGEFEVNDDETQRLCC